MSEKKSTNKSTKADEPKNELVPWGIGASIGMGLLAYLLPQFIIGFVIAGVATFQEKSIDQVLGDENLLLNFAITVTIAAIGGWLIYRFVKKRDGLRFLGLGKTKTVDVLLGFPAYVVYFILLVITFQLVAGFAPQVDLDQDQVVGYENASGVGVALAFVSLVIIAPFFEEMLFRGFTFRGIADKAGFWPAAVGTSLLFGLAHGQANVAIDTFILGMVACYLVWNTKSTWPAIMLHSIKNFIAFIFLFYIS